MSHRLRAIWYLYLAGLKIVYWENSKTQCCCHVATFHGLNCEEKAGCQLLLMPQIFENISAVQMRKDLFPDPLMSANHCNTSYEGARAEEAPRLACIAFYVTYNICHALNRTLKFPPPDVHHLS